MSAVGLLGPNLVDILCHFWAVFATVVVFLIQCPKLSPRCGPKHGQSLSNCNPGRRRHREEHPDVARRPEGQGAGGAPPDHGALRGDPDQPGHEGARPGRRRQVRERVQGGHGEAGRPRDRHHLRALLRGHGQGQSLQFD